MKRGGDKTKWNKRETVEEKSMSRGMRSMGKRKEKECKENGEVGGRSRGKRTRRSRRNWLTTDTKAKGPR